VFWTQHCILQITEDVLLCQDTGPGLLSLSASTLRQGKSGKTPKGSKIAGSLDGSGFASVDPSRSRCLGYGRGEKMALEKRVAGGNEVLAGKIQKALHIWALSRAMPANQPQGSTGDDSRRFKQVNH